METVPFVDLKAQYARVKPEVQAAMDNVLDTGAFILGPDVAAFEEEFARYCGVKYSVGVESGTAALRVALQALGIGPGDEVILPANTYIASALAVSQVGAKVVFVDMDETYLIDAARIEAAITPRTKAIMPVHLYGRAVPWEPIVGIAQAHGLRIVEDASQAHGALAGGRRVGSFGDVGCFSFYPGKNLGAYGDAGAVVTDDARIADAVRLERDFGQRYKYEHLVKGDNCRLDSIQAAVLRVKLRYLDDWNANRRAIAMRYDNMLKSIGVEPPARTRSFDDVYHLYVVELGERDRARDLLSGLGIQTGIHYPVPIHLQPAYRDLGLARGSFPKTEAAASQLLSLPMFPELTEAQIERVVAGIQSHLTSVRASTRKAG